MRRLPLFLQIWGAFSLAMIVPAVDGWLRDDMDAARAFLYSFAAGMLGIALVGLALGNGLGAAGESPRGRRDGGKERGGRTELGQLLSLLGAFALLPAFLAVPVADALDAPDAPTYLAAYADMVGAVTTTGADFRERVGAESSATVELWRAIVAWLGGLAMWIAAAAILAPLSLGGFEITTRGQPGLAIRVQDYDSRNDPARRVWSQAASLAPLYAGLTAVVAILLLMVGESGFVAVCHAMSTMATSGISPVGPTGGGDSGIAGEAILFLFMAFGLSRLTFSADTAQAGHSRLDRDPEFRWGIMLVLGVTAILLLSELLAPRETGLGVATLRAIWGSMFTAMSYLTTTGFVSEDWGRLGEWTGTASGSAAMFLMGLAMIGGGVATTAGGVKLLRVWVLYRNGIHEIGYMIHPSAVKAIPADRTRIGQGGALLAWVAFMLFALSLAGLAIGFSALGAEFPHAIALAVSGLSTTGPLLHAVDPSLHAGSLSPAAMLLYCLAMVIGRLETLAIVALAAPGMWRG